MSFSLSCRLTSSSSLALICSILLKVVSPAFTMAVDRAWPETQCSIKIYLKLKFYILKVETGWTSPHTSRSLSLSYSSNILTEAVYTPIFSSCLETYGEFSQSLALKHLARSRELRRATKPVLDRWLRYSDRPDWH